MSIRYVADTSHRGSRNQSKTADRINRISRIDSACDRQVRYIRFHWSQQPPSSCPSCLSCRKGGLFFLPPCHASTSPNTRPTTWHGPKRSDHSVQAIPFRDAAAGPGALLSVTLLDGPRAGWSVARWLLEVRGPDAGGSR